jgi:hypothetical protein
MVTTFELTVGPTFTIDREGVGLAVVITPAVKMIEERDGSVYTILPVTLDIAPGEMGSVNLPHTNQPGFVDSGGTVLSNWFYRVEVEEHYADTRVGYIYRKFIRAETGTVTLDLDLIPEDGTAPGIEKGTTVTIVTPGQLIPGPKGEKGDKGDQGDRGNTGSQGAQGIQGPQGAKGDKGDKGDTGNPGAQGVQGIQGPQGTPGTNGTNGTNGNTILTGSGVPSNGIGANGDLYYDPTAKIMYGPKASGTWPAGVSLQGPQGTQGIQGTQGPQGTPGTNGTNGTNGSNGAYLSVADSTARDALTGMVDGNIAYLRSDKSEWKYNGSAWIAYTTAWAALTLSNSWVNYDAVYANAQIRLVRGVAHVKGLIKSGTTTSNTLLTTFPAGMRPPTKEMMHVVSSSSGPVSGYLDLNTDGTLVIQNNIFNTWLNIKMIFMPA